MGKSTISMAIFHSYVSLPEGKQLLWLENAPPGASSASIVHQVFRQDQ